MRLAPLCALGIAATLVPGLLDAQTTVHPPAREVTAGTVARSADATSVVIHGLYVNRWAAQSKPRMRSLIRFARETGINAMVIDLKDEFGLNFQPADSAARRFAGRSGGIPDVRWLVDTLRANGLVPIARLVVFKDSVTARARPDWTILGPDGLPWRDKQGLTWVNPYHHELWDYNIGVATEAAALGFAEIQFDYIRFPEPYPTLPKQAFPGANGVSKSDVLAAFLREARARLSPLGVRTTADVFGLVTTIKIPLEVGQQWEALASVTDVLLPMVYPSHYVPGSFGIARPDAAPYEIVKAAVSRAVERNTALGIKGERVRPYLQAFTLGKPPYGDAELAAQFRATYESGVNGWILWNPGSQYDHFRGALIGDAARRTGTR
jgi:hypothetical protein